MAKPTFLMTLALVATASACGSVSPAGLLAASRLDPLTTPPAEVALAVGVPQVIRLADGDAELRMSLHSGDGAAAILREEVATLVLAPSGDTGPRPNSPSETVYVARIAAEDAPRIAALQQDIRDLRAMGNTGTGALTISVVGGCLVGAPPPSMAVSTWIQTDPDAGFVPLTRRQDVTRAIGARDAGLLLSQLRPCGDQG